MELVRYLAPASSSPAAGRLDRDASTITPLGLTMSALLRLDLAAITARWADADADAALALDDCTLLVPVEERIEIWAAGVTYERSRDERMKESAASASVYDRVYDAPRPEVFFKSVAWRVVGDGAPIAIRRDSEIDVPEAELAVLVNAHGEIVGYTVCNDVSSRSIEGENPLYLPQAKIYAGSCALSSAVRPAWEIADPYALTIELTITRGGGAVFSARASTAQLHRRLDDLVAVARAELDFPDGFVLSTGTSLVPELPFTLEAGDEVAIVIGDVGTLTNPVVSSASLLSR